MADPISEGRSEDRVLIFVDMLGFADLTLRHPRRVESYGPDQAGVTGAATTPLQSRIVRFLKTLDLAIAHESLRGGVSAMIFSDCAYIDAHNPYRTATLAVGLMRAYFEARIPVRMGIGRGTFYGFKYSMESTDTDVVTRSLFAGTAVVNAYRAERCGAKGCRILLHKSLASVLPEMLSENAILDLPEPHPEVSKELSYVTAREFVWEYDSSTGRKSYIDQDRSLRQGLREMLRASEPLAEPVRIHYEQTNAAIDRMRRVVGRRSPWSLQL